MPLNLASPGIVVREIDLTTGRTAPAQNRTGALVAPFSQGPVNVPILIENESDLLNTFGQPSSTNKQYEYWFTASSYLSYGGNLRVVRANDTKLKNSVAEGTEVKIDSLDHYNDLGYDENTLSGRFVAARNPGTWGNDLRVCIIDNFADQILTGIDTSANNIVVGYGVTQDLSGKVSAGVGTTTVLDGYLKGIITGIGASVGLGTSQISVKVLSKVSSAGTETSVEYQESSNYAFKADTLYFLDNTKENGDSPTGSAQSATSAIDWFNSQKVGVTSSLTIDWSSVAPRPGTSSFAAARGSKFDEVHILVIDAKGSVTGNAGTILEKHLSLSKAKDAEFSAGSPSYWRKYLANNSEYIFGLGEPLGVTSTSSGFLSNEYTLITDNAWDQNAEGITFKSAGAKDYSLTNGKNYGGQVGFGTTSLSLKANLSGLSEGYDLFENTDNFTVDFLLMGSAFHTKEDCQALANKIISVAELRQDAIAFVSPNRGSLLSDTSDETAVNVYSAATITNNLIEYYSPITSSSYGVFDSGYKYMYDRFNDTFRYIPLNGDIAGLCARTDINLFPWYSPAGTAKGAILNAVKLAYNPTKSQRDKLYSARINPVVFSPGAGIILFGDKTGLAKASAFDRINVRRLFIYLEDAISAAAKDAMFEFNDEITRTNFVNTVEPFLRDVQSNRGITDYVVICDETNNTAAVIDNNEFVADIFIKPARSINFIGLTFVATKTGVDFEEVIGNF